MHAYKLCMTMNHNYKLGCLIYYNQSSFVPSAYMQGRTNVTKMVEEIEQPQPYILVIGDSGSEWQAFLITDKKVVTEVPFENTPLTLMSAFFVYNICYPNGCTNFYTFMEVVILNFAIEEASTYSKTSFN